MKSFFKGVVLTFSAVTITLLGLWGYETETSETSVAWKLTGIIVSTAIIIVPVIDYWHDKIKLLFKSEEQANKH